MPSIGATVVGAIVLGNGPSIAASVALAGVAATFAVTARRLPAVVDEGDPLRLVTSQALTLDQIDVRPGGILVAVRNPNRARPLSPTRSPRRSIATSR